MFAKVLDILSSIDKLFLFENDRYDPDELDEPTDHDLMLNPYYEGNEV